MSRLLSVEARSVGELFKGAQGFRLPWFQRAYTWRTPQVARLIGDLVEAAERKDDAEFLLGTLLLADAAGRDRLAIVDGHQRIMTLTIIAAVLRDLAAPGALRTRLDALVGRGRGGYRLEPQSYISEFLARYVQREGGTALDVDESEVAFSDSERCVVEVREYIRSRLQAGNGADFLRADIALLLLDRCKVIVQTYDNEDYAWRILDIEETTRLTFIPGAQAKATILGVMPANEREIASRTWETCEDRIGTAGVGEVLGHIRVLKSRKRSERPVELDICKLFEVDRGSGLFLDQWLVPNVDRYDRLRGSGRAAAWDGGAIARSIEALNWIEPAVWMPAAMHWLDKHDPADEGGVEFFRRLERLTWLMRIAGVDPSHQTRRMISVLDQLDNGRRNDPEIPALAIEPSLRRDALDSLRSQNFCLKHHAHLVLRRLSVLMGRDTGPVDRENVTIEHMLPRNPDKNRRWWRAFASANDVKAHVNRIGNLTFLSHDDNQAAATKDWPEKRKILARSGFVLSENAAQFAEWDRAAIIARGEMLIALLMRDWDLQDATP